ncbi:uncharacterized protein LOC124270833 isoform X2 [Haliotis rubra]|uniref:uncharacterized protein LOC124270833 isoform X2 n=1 Tax=Haliotis rubra TaxID=36100 RepID=UPI001EE63010|nr:uncharacterized protein LOC124270833 isoform X2 [Haliotis rubra]
MSNETTHVVHNPMLHLQLKSYFIITFPVTINQTRLRKASVRIISMAQKIPNLDFSTDQLLTTVFQEVKDIMNDQVHLHETMMRTSVLYKSTYTHMTEKMKTLQEKLPLVSPALLNLMMDYTKLVTASTDAKPSDSSLPKAKKSGKVKKQHTTKESIHSNPKKATQKQRRQKEKSTPAASINFPPNVDDVNTPPNNLMSTQSTSPLMAESITLPSLDGWNPNVFYFDGKWLDNSLLNDPFEQEKLTPLQKGCSICLHNNMLRHMSCNSGQVQCHVCCMDLMNCLCYHDPEGMMEDMVTQDFEGHILTV